MVRKPSWLKICAPSGTNAKRFSIVRDTLEKHHLHSICVEAKCPNACECWGGGTATFLLLGKVCTRNCRFCSAKHAGKGEQVDAREPENIACAVRELKLSYVVLTSVDRDDLSDGGALHFAECIRAVKKARKGVFVEALIPDFSGREDCLRIICDAEPDVVGHNVEVVRELQLLARDARASYKQSLKVLESVKKINSKIITKSSLMVGLGETSEMVLRAMDDLRAVGVDALTIGQYLQPARSNLPVKEFVSPEKFAEWEKAGRGKGFLFVASGPLVRSSYKAGEFYLKNILSRARKNRDEEESTCNCVD
ncbi:lipoyl synthase [Candidatus Micrarchaeota archaeon]|nr:lipoyl synthase [Candidatus Micrarchaeota archaeon]